VRRPVDRARSRHVEIAEEVAERLDIDRAIKVRVRDQRLELRSEDDAPARLTHEERFDAHAVANQRERPRRGVPHGNGEHPDEPRHGVGNPPSLERGEDHLGVAVSSKAPAIAQELGAQRTVIEDLAVENQGETAGGRAHRLMALLRQVDDGEAAEAEGDAGVRVDHRAAVVRSSVHERLRHSPNGALELLRALTAGRQYSSESAHARCDRGRWEMAVTEGSRRSWGLTYS
jgi:hypothetical protein